MTITEAEAQSLLVNALEFQLRRPTISSLSNIEEKAKEICYQCFVGGGTPTCNLISYYGDSLGEVILEKLKELDSNGEES